MGGSIFWDWFDGDFNGIIFSLAPASSLTIIDYQTFDRKPTFESCVFDEPTTVAEPKVRAVRTLGFIPRGE